MKRYVSLLVCVMLVGCGSPAPDGAKKVGAATPAASATNGEIPSFSLAPSEYPSWSTFMVAAKLGLLDSAKGKQGTLEKKYNIDVVLDVQDYDTCLTKYGNGSVDAACLTNMDSLNPALSRPSTIICPTSTSAGGDQVIAVGVENIEGLKKETVYGLSKSVSEYTFRRGLEKSGQKPSDFKFEHLDPGPAATALQTGSGKVKAICVWNPFALTVTSQNKDAKVIYSSDLIKGEILDCVVIGNDSLKREGADRFCLCILEAFYDVSKRLDDPQTEQVTTKALGEDFSNLNVDQMKTVLKQTLLYKTPADGIALFKGNDLKTTMQQVVKTCTEIEIITKDKTPTIGYGKGDSQLTFETKFMEQLAK